jgi:hypothetical protein
MAEAAATSGSRVNMPASMSPLNNARKNMTTPGIIDVPMP